MPHPKRAVAMCTIVLATSAVWEVPARAQDGEATRLFEEGVALREAGDSVGAIERLRRAHALDPGDRTAYNLAAALVDRGDFVEAQRLLRRVVARQRDLLVADAARELLASVDAQVASVQLRIASLQPTHALFVDGAATDPGAGAREISLDPGRHRLEVRDDRGVVLARTDVELREGERRAVVLHPVASARASSSAARADANGARERSATSPQEPASGGDDAWVWVGVGAGIAAAVAIGVAIAVLALGGQSGGTAQPSDLPPVIVRGRDG
ncbi:cadherin-like beta sandwich domain-containing protein [Sandaracinus amylolyticus]|uniref:Tetratricopeptide repeat protein n=1 Tax=Sandaracinus amylolyticus TaxID=927083 RepID=A0A0F6YIM1_9BACT|nr:tetratricopeptide repeat protein [Sandaracinus amylolyticus]AKF07203.1 hypothetical protein DB32_004352 [Sandaracinus amylolyticus]